MPIIKTAIPSSAGIAVLDLIHALEEDVGSAAVALGRERLPPRAREELAEITSISWVANTTVSALVDAVAAAAGVDPEPMLDRAIRRGVERTFKTVWRMLLRLSSDEALIKRTPMIYSRSRNVGELSARIVEPGRAELKLTEWPEITDRQMRSVGVGIESVIALTGRRSVQMRCTRTASGAVFDLRWQV
jgi:hypothetical protein